MKGTLIVISAILMSVLVTRTYHLRTLVSHTPLIWYNIKEHTRHYEQHYSKMKLLVKQRLHTKDPLSDEYLSTVQILHDLDSLYQIRSYHPKRLIKLIEYLKTFQQCSSRFNEVDLQLPEDFFRSPNQHLWCGYYNAKILDAFMEELLNTIVSSSCVYHDKPIFIQDYSPVSKDYLVYFGAFEKCSDPYYHIKVNDRIARYGEFSYTPTKVGIDSLLIEIERFDANAKVVVQDTFYYPIEVVDSALEARS